MGVLLYIQRCTSWALHPTYRQFQVLAARPGHEIPRTRLCAGAEQLALSVPAAAAMRVYREAADGLGALGHAPLHVERQSLEHVARQRPVGPSDEVEALALSVRTCLIDKEGEQQRARGCQGDLQKDAAANREIREIFLDPSWPVNFSAHFARFWHNEFLIRFAFPEWNIKLKRLFERNGLISRH